VSNALLALWIALIGADRVDLSGGKGPFVVTPFLALTPIVVLSELLRRRIHGVPVSVSRAALGYAAAAAALLSVVFTSTFFSDAIGVSGARSMLLLLGIFGTFAVGLVTSDRRDAARVLARGALASLVAFAVCDVFEAFWYLGRGPEILRAGPMSIRFDALQNAGPIPRLAGLVGDGNRAGFVLVFYIAIIAMGEPRLWARRVGVGFGVLLLAATISRSATLGALATLGMTILTRRFKPSLAAMATVTVAVAAMVTLLLTNPRALDWVTGVVNSPVAGRLSSKEGSAQSHVALLGRGIDEATASLPRAAIGLGYGNAYLVLQDMFPGNRYGNFHSLYVTMFAESGILALLLVLVLMGTPLVLGGPWRALVAGSFAFNIFYQTTAEPVFWFLLAVAWLTMPTQAKAWRTLNAPAATETPR
jgi:hypothetical protein